ncbi:MAG TPA: hypothetical protein VFI06_08120 [Chitinophagaceae bacterium]|nr:hypothetical protein [Chitinophagaceae bacterium]
MKNTVRSPFYFSAYPLKAISGTAVIKKDQGSPYLKAILSGKTKTGKRARVFPMINPYTKQSGPAPFQEGKLTKDIELVEKEWFNNYE